MKTRRRGDDDRDATNQLTRRRLGTGFPDKNRNTRADYKQVKSSGAIPLTCLSERERRLEVTAKPCTVRNKMTAKRVTARVRLYTSHDGVALFR